MQTLRFRCIGTAAAVALAAAATVTAQDPRINEVRVGQLGTDTEEYFELAGTPGTLNGKYYIVIGNDDDTGNNGVVEEVVNLLGQAIKVSGYFTVVEDTFTLPGIPNLARPLNFEGGNRTHLLVTDFTGQLGQDLDTDDDGVLDIIPWNPPTPIDCVALVGPGTPGIDGDHVYCATQVGPDGDFVPGQVYRCEPDLTWKVGEFDISVPPVTDTPGTVNTSCDLIPPCGSDVAGSCYVANGTPNCDDTDCCNEIINNWDPSCEDNWDQLCADLAQTQCRSCGDPDSGSCFEANGTAYCDIAACCDTVCAIDPTCCQLNGWGQTCADLAVENCDLSLQPGDVVIGLSDPDPNLTLALARGEPVANGGTLAIEAWSEPYIQSVDLDNLGGISHNPEGNLLGVNFGTTTTSGTIFNLPTCQPLGPGQLIGNTVGLGGAGITQSRLAGISVSPDNTKIAVVAYDTGKVIVYDYVAGDCLGAGAVLSGARETTDAPMCLEDTQGTAWLDDNTVLAFSSVGSIVGVDATAMTTTDLASLSTTCGPAFTDIEFNAAISPYVYAMNSEFSGGTSNTLWVLDPDNAWGILNQVDYSLSINTTREIALGPGGDLFVSQYTGNIELIANAAGNAGSLGDNDSLDWFNTSGEVDFSAFPGLDVAVGAVGGPCPCDCQPEPNGRVDATDFLALLSQWGNPGSCDCEDPPDGAVDAGDFLALLGAWGDCP